MPGRIVVTGRVPEPALELLREAGEVDAHMQETALSVEELHAAVAGADAVVTLLSDRVDDAFLEAAGPQLRVVSNVAVGYNNIDVAACSARGVLVTNTPGVLTDATADIAMALILMVMRRLGEGERVIRSQTGWRWHMHYMLGTSLQGKTLGIVGMGQIGTATARRARAFGMEIIYSGRRRADEELEAELGATFFGFDDLLGHERRRLAALPADPRDAPPDHRRAPGPDARRRLPRQHDARARGRRGRARRGAAQRRDQGRGPRRVRARARCAPRRCSSSRTRC